MGFDLRLLGWKAFQDLCATVSAEVLERPVQTFLPTRDGGRDGAFLGTWRPGGGAVRAKSTIQCKFSEQPGAKLSLSKLSSELKKAATLAKNGLAEDYVILTNAGVTGLSDERICRAFEGAGVQTCQVFDGDWILRQIRERPRLRMMVPRVYGLLDLAGVIVGPAYDQARAIISSMGHDLGAFVPTASHRKAVEALGAHGFVLLVGDPATGKSTIGATLALGALDGGCTGAIRISSPDLLHLWRPAERQFLWVDDAFGPTQYEPARVQRWNAELPLLKAAVRDGAKVVFTTRNYIWERARQHLKLSAFALLSESQVVVDVQELTSDERAQILYNHVRNGGQSREMRRRLKPHLARLASNPALTPEIARRLGDPFITARLPIAAPALDAFVNHPVEFLKEVITNLGDAGRAALALVFMHPASGLPSPIQRGETLETVTRLTGVESAEIARELQAMNGSLTLLVPGPDSDRWVFRHPTIGDAFADIVANSQELVELYVAGARLERLMVEVTCGPHKPTGAKVRVPEHLYRNVIERMSAEAFDDIQKGFLVSRCDARFVAAFADRRPEVLRLSPGTPMQGHSNTRVLSILAHFGLLSEAKLAEVFAKIEEFTIVEMDTGLFNDEEVRRLVTDEQFTDLETRFRATWLDDLDDTVRNWRYNWFSSDPLGLAQSFKEDLSRLERLFCTTSNASAFIKAHDALDDWIAELEEEQPEQTLSTIGPVAAVEPGEGSTGIFEDIDA
ncbi:hypothetical protein MBUL_00727 [Methylobacterium bullatum]|uniref:Novel STAND NTPase 3 domain-containing protein n=1 Tax=Methylobacterium bullatum TaxID=570505 RepID=A0A679IY50_9HYPH|nr:hypothetical protein MBUL_00727 [Methylobacterium bullatum]